MTKAVNDAELPRLPAVVDVPRGARKEGPERPIVFFHQLHCPSCHRANIDSAGGRHFVARLIRGGAVASYSQCMDCGCLFYAVDLDAPENTGVLSTIAFSGKRKIGS